MVLRDPIVRIINLKELIIHWMTVSLIRHLIGCLQGCIVNLLSRVVSWMLDSLCLVWKILVQFLAIETVQRCRWQLIKLSRIRYEKRNKMNQILNRWIIKLS